MNVPQLHRLLVGAGRTVHIDTIYKAKRTGYFSRGLALDCEEVTGIAREKWVFPEIFGNPWVARKLRKARQRPREKTDSLR